MLLKDILESTPGLNRRFVHYLESKGYIQPHKIQKQRIARREYRDSDLETIQEVWRYYQRGYALQAAYDLAKRSDRALGYITFLAFPHWQRELLEGLKECPQVVEASCVYGTSFDVIVKTDTPDESDVYANVIPALAKLGLQGHPQYRLTEQRYVNLAEEREEGPKGMQAYLIMKVPGKGVGRVMEALKGIDSIKEASTVYGESDIIAKVQVDNQEDLDSLVINRIHGIPDVESTRTFIVIRNLHWSR